MLYDLSATTLISMIKNREITAYEVSVKFIERISQVNHHINAISQVNSQKIMLEAQEADRKILSNEPVGKLHGLPLSIKDCCHVKGFHCSKGFPGFLNGQSEYDATVVKRLKDAGAIILGITNTPELLLSYETDNLIYGRTNNPYDLSRTPGGSSGGEAAIISAGGSPVGIGSDAGGSIRVPAHYSGICGHKPTQGLVPATGNIPVNGAGIVTQLLTMGPMSRHVEDLFLIMDVISGYDDKDPHSSPSDFYSLNIKPLEELKIGYYFHHDNIMASEDTVATIKNIISMLTEVVKSIKEYRPKPIKDIFRLHWETFMLGGDKGRSLQYLFELYGNQPPSPLSQEFLKGANKVEFSITELRQRLVEVEQFRYEMSRCMDEFDIILSPVSSTPARLHGETHKNIEEYSYTTVHNLSGWPATVIPCGLSNTGLPIGVQIAAKPWCDKICLALAQYIQSRIGVFAIPDIA